MQVVSANEVNSMTVCGVLVTYNPDETIKRVVQTSLEELDALVLIDNNSDDRSRSLIKESLNLIHWSSQSKCQIHLILNKENEGLPKSYNNGIKFALKNNYDFMIFLDQDSILTTNTISMLKKCYSTLSRFEKNFALTANNIEARPLVLDGVLNDYYIRKGLKAYDCAREVMLIINSGFFISAQKIALAGLFDEKYFIDSVDHEISLRLGLMGTKLFLVKDAVINHSLGQSRSSGIKSLRFSFNEHGPARSYYIFRDRTRTVIKYFKKYPVLTSLMAASIVLQFFITIIFFKKRLEHLSAIINGLFDVIKPSSGGRQWQI
ncbi:MAG: glycosyltransferase [Thermoplasmatales archaeon]